MLKHYNEGVFVYNVDYAANGHFFTGSLNLLNLDFDPLIQGFAFIKWTAVPNWVLEAYPSFTYMTEKNFKEFGGLSDIELGTSAIQHGFNANEYYVATGMQKQNTEFTLKHQEFSGSPMRAMYQYWITGIRDPETGIATYPRLAGLSYAAKNHTGELCYIATRPDANNVDDTNIEFACYYAAVIPTRIQINQFNHTIGSHDPQDYDQTLKGNFYMSPKVDAFARNLLTEFTYGTLEMSEFNPEEPDDYHINMDSTRNDGVVEKAPHSEWDRTGRGSGNGAFRPGQGNA